MVETMKERSRPTTQRVHRPLLTRLIFSKLHMSRKLKNFKRARSFTSRKKHSREMTYSSFYQQLKARIFSKRSRLLMATPRSKRPKLWNIMTLPLQKLVKISIKTVSNQLTLTTKNVKNKFNSNQWTSRMPITTPKPTSRKESTQKTTSLSNLFRSNWVTRTIWRMSDHFSAESLLSQICLGMVEDTSFCRMEKLCRLAIVGQKTIHTLILSRIIMEAVPL